MTFYNRSVPTYVSPRARVKVLFKVNGPFREHKWPDLAVADCALQCYYFDMSWRRIAYAVMMAVAGAIAFTTVIDLGRIAIRLWH
jgi:hypothetical protein